MSDARHCEHGECLSTDYKSPTSRVNVVDGCTANTVMRSNGARKTLEKEDCENEDLTALQDIPVPMFGGNSRWRVSLI